MAGERMAVTEAAREMRPTKGSGAARRRSGREVRILSGCRGPLTWRRPPTSVESSRTLVRSGWSR
jgi:hypothetical protein